MSYSWCWVRRERVLSIILNSLYFLVYTIFRRKLWNVYHGSHFIGEETEALVKDPQVRQLIVGKTWIIWLQKSLLKWLSYTATILKWRKWKWRHSVVSTSLRPRGLYVAHQAPLSMGFSRQEYWSGLPFPSPRDLPGFLNVSRPCIFQVLFDDNPDGVYNYYTLTAMHHVITSPRLRSLWLCLKILTIILLGRCILLALLMTATKFRGIM